MIIRATFENILSFRDEAQISFVAGKSDTHSHHVVRAKKRNDISVLKFGIVYGANASGKSNIIKAVSLIRDIAIGSFPRYWIEPFKLSVNNTEHSKIELEIKRGSKYYAYGVEFSVEGLKEEWLYEINSRVDKMIFERTVDDNGNNFNFGTVNGGASSSTLLKFISHATPKDKSFLSEYVVRNGVGLEDIREVYEWFLDCLHIIFPDTRFDGISYRTESHESLRDGTIKLLDYFGTGFSSMKEIPVSAEESDIPSNEIKDIIAKATPGNIYFIVSKAGGQLYSLEVRPDRGYRLFNHKPIHLDESGKEVLFEMRQESDGTQRLLEFVPMLLDLKNNDSVYLIDEIDRSMHPMLSRKLLECFDLGISEEKDSQLIFTTHESNLLDLDLIRADEVWFVEKDAAGASHLTSLAEYKPREDIRRGYLLGRYGAIPFFASIKNLKW